MFYKIIDFLVSRLALIFGSMSLDNRTNNIEKVITSQKIWETQNSVSNCGIPTFSAAFTAEERKIDKNKSLPINI